MKQSRECRYRRTERRLRIMYFINLLYHRYKLDYADSIYDIKNYWNQINIDYYLYPADAYTAYRCIQIAHRKGACPIDPETVPPFPGCDCLFYPDKYSQLVNMYNRMRAYWDDVLDKYKSSVARKKRIAYLIDRLLREGEDPFLDNNDVVISKVDELILHYRQQQK